MNVIGLMLIAGLILVVIGLVGLLLVRTEDEGGQEAAPAETETETKEEEHGDAV